MAAIDAQLAAPFGDDFYLARVDWAPAGWAEGAHGPVLLAQVQSRDQRSLALLRLDPRDFNLQLLGQAVSIVLVLTMMLGLMLLNLVRANVSR